MSIYCCGLSVRIIPDRVANLAELAVLTMHTAQRPSKLPAPRPVNAFHVCLMFASMIMNVTMGKHVQHTPG